MKTVSLRSRDLPRDAHGATTCTLTDISSTNFGFLIAYLLPGFTAIWGAAGVSPTLRSWLATPPNDAATIGGFLYVTLASVAVGLTVSTLRWLVIDSLHHATGLKRPQWDYSKLQANLGAYDRLEQNHYRYYQFYANMVIALPVAYLLRRHTLDLDAATLVMLDGAAVAITLLFALGSRDTLAKYYGRSLQLLRAETGVATQTPHAKSARFKKSTKGTL